VYIFNPVDVRLCGYLRSVAESAAELIPDAEDLLDPEVIRRYFELHYWRQEGDSRWDDHHIMECFPPPPQRLHFQFRTASDQFQFIEDVGKPVFIPYGERGQRLVAKLRVVYTERDGRELRGLLRRLQRYTISIYKRIYDAMLGSDIELLDSGYAILINDSCYDDQLGFRADRAGCHEPDALIG